MRCKVPIPPNNSFTDAMTKLSWHTYLGSALTILICALSGMAIPSYSLSSEAIAETWLLAQSGKIGYGLGLPKTATTGGGTRLVNRETGDGRSFGRPSILRSLPRDSQSPSSQKQELPLLTLIMPEDGARTASPQPTLYWYLSAQNTQSSTPESTANLDKKDIFLGQLSITTWEDTKPVTILQTDLKMHSGLSKFKLPIAASLKPSQTYRWQITLPDQKVTASGWIVYTPPEDALQKSLARALTIRDRAKIYAQFGYWFDAIDGYTRWLNFKPEDLKARGARNEVLKSGFVTNKNLDFDSFIGLLNADTPKNKQVVMDK
jgi:hypothetical protein